MSPKELKFNRSKVWLYHHCHHPPLVLIWTLTSPSTLDRNLRISFKSSSPLPHTQLITQSYLLYISLCVFFLFLISFPWFKPSSTLTRTNIVSSLHPPTHHLLLQIVLSKPQVWSCNQLFCLKSCSVSGIKVQTQEGPESASASCDVIHHSSWPQLCIQSSKLLTCPKLLLVIILHSFSGMSSFSLSHIDLENSWSFFKTQITLQMGHFILCPVLVSCI